MYDNIKYSPLSCVLEMHIHDVHVVLNLLIHHHELCGLCQLITAALHSGNQTSDNNLLFIFFFPFVILKQLDNVWRYDGCGANVEVPSITHKRLEMAS